MQPAPAHADAVRGAVGRCARRGPRCPRGDRRRRAANLRPVRPAALRLLPERPGDRYPDRGQDRSAVPRRRRLHGRAERLPRPGPPDQRVPGIGVHRHRRAAVGRQDRTRSFHGDQHRDPGRKTGAGRPVYPGNVKPCRDAARAGERGTDRLHADSRRTAETVGLAADHRCRRPHLRRTPLHRRHAGTPGCSTCAPRRAACAPGTTWASSSSTT